MTDKRNPAGLMLQAAIFTSAIFALTSPLALGDDATPAPSPKPPSSILIQNGQKIAFLGDSITAQGWGNTGGYVHLVVAGLSAEGIQVTPIPAGISGHTSRDMLGRLDRDVLSKKPDWMTLSCGVNDVWHGPTGVDLPTYEKNITSIVDQAQAQGIKVLILTSTVIMEDLSKANVLNQKLAPYNDFLRQLAKEKGCPIADLSAAYINALTTTPPPPGTLLLTVDGVHPNPNGHMTMATGVLEGLGVPASDMPKIMQAWNAIPTGAKVDLQLKETEAMSLGTYQKLEKVAAAQGTNVNGLTNRWYLQALDEAIHEHSSDTQNLTAIQNEAQQKFDALVSAATKAP